MERTLYYLELGIPMNMSDDALDKILSAFMRQCDIYGVDCRYQLKNKAMLKDKPYSAERETLSEDKPQQPTVPIQFVWHDGVLYHESDCINMGMGLEENCTVEQIGAVRYVRSKE